MSIYVFVYGTLRAGEINDLARAAARRGLTAPRPVGRGTVRGTLYDFGDWPGLLPDGGGQAIVGDIHEVDPALLALMDEIEEVDPSGGSCFLRRKTRVRLEAPARAAGGRGEVGVGVGKETFLDCYYYPIDPAWAGAALATPATDWVAYRRGRARPA
ncbi:gamma-glutamylcyclotransferase family protein [Achromobacter aloeverae]|uniref:Gamma-glutamylcyclotransferase n=1 Tax=Achromobacter aloeverae TaxID=1750518 RepID=A0A4V1MSR9_9BURK|nr:gamma-glutamylcyclotransferase family protein [Achromobacter aloeverae]RXN93000.1 gamma-glutamylcyclotransferase [Achromobacter aloeverae]